MKVLSVLGIVMLVLAVVSNAIDLFPLGLASAREGTPVTEDMPFSKEAVEETAEKVGSMYGTVIDDLISFQRNPDLTLAESRRTEMAGYADTLVDQFRDLADTLQLELDALTP